MLEHFFSFFSIIRQYGKLTWNHATHSNLPQKAAQLTLSSLLAFVPIITIILGVLGLTPTLSNVQTQFFAFIETYLTPGASSAIFPYLLQFSEQAKHLPIAGLATLFLTALLLLNNFEASVQSIWSIRKARKIRERLLTYWAILTLGPIILIAIISLYGTVLTFQIKGIELSQVLNKLLDIGSILLYFLMLSTLNYLTPNSDVSIKLAAIASAFGSIGLFLLNNLFSLFAHYFTNYQVIYGAFAAIPIFLIWLQSTWLIILTSICLCAALHNHKT